MNDIERILNLRSGGSTFEQIERLTGISKRLIRRIIDGKLPDKIELKEFNLCPYELRDCISFDDDVCSCNLTDTRFFRRDGMRKPCPFFKDRKDWLRQEIRRLTEDQKMTKTDTAKILGISTNQIWGLTHETK